MKKQTLILLSTIPLVLGFILEFLMKNLNFFGIGFNLMGIILLFIVFAIGKKSVEGSTKALEAILLGNFLGFVSLAIILVSVLLKGQYPTGLIGRIAQNYFLPLIGLTARLDVFNMFKSVTAIIAVSFALMLIFFHLGQRKGIHLK